MSSSCKLRSWLLQCAVLLLLIMPLCIRAGSFWHITDLHWDPRYEVGAYSRCTDAETYGMCCRNDSVPKKDHEQFRAGPFGDPNCDSPFSLISGALDFLADNPAEFIIWTGDSTDHDVFNQELEYNLELIYNTTQLVKKYLPGVRIFPILGNHDYYPVSGWRAPPDCDWLLRNVSEWWADWLDEASMETFLVGGYYSTVIRPGLRLIALNTNFYDSFDTHAHLYDLHSDPGNQFAWLEATLAAASDAGEQVWIAAHVAPGPRSSTGKEDAVPLFPYRYVPLIEQYSDIVAGQFYGHWHRDEFKIFKNTSGPYSMLYMTPSLTPFRWSNPSLRQFSYDETSFLPTDYDQYYVNLTRANKENQMNFELEYSARQFWNLTDMSPASWLNIADSLLNGNDTFNKYWSVHTVQDTYTHCEDHHCQRRTYCAMTNIHQFDYLGCMLL